MSADITSILLVGATAASGLLAGASLDQSIKQLPARHKIGVVAFSRYSQAADLGPGIAFYATLGLAAAGLNIAAAIAAYLQGLSVSHATAIYAGALVAFLHTLVTARAAPTNFSQRHARDETSLKSALDRFTRLQRWRCALQVVNFALNLWALAVVLPAR